MTTNVNPLYTYGGIRSEETSTVINEGEAVAVTGLRSNGGADFAGISKFTANPGEPLTLETGRVFVKFGDTPTLNAALTVNATGQLIVATAGTYVVGYHLEDENPTNSDLGIAYVYPAPAYIVPTP